MRLIDADKLIDAMNLWGMYKHENPNAYDTLMKYEILQEIENQPTINQWIPVSERLPNADEMYKCLYVNSCGAYMTEAYIYEVCGTYNCEDDYTILCDVVAWMPLPEPYKGDDGE